MSFDKLIVALAGTEDEHALIRTAIRLASALRAQLAVLHVRHSAAKGPHMMMDGPDRRDEQDLRRLIREAGHATEAERLEISIVESRTYHEPIAAATADADLMIVGHSPRNAFLAALVQATDEKVANLARCPVVVVPKG